MTHPAIRLATADDAAAAVAVLHEAARWLIDTDRRLWEPHELELQPILDRAHAGELYVADDGGAVVALMLVQTRDELFWPNDPPGEASYLHRLAVARSHAGTGLAGRMIEHAAFVAERRGNAFLRLDCETRPALLSLYARHGFDEVDRGIFHTFHLARLQRRLR